MYNKSIGRFHLTGIPPSPRGIPQIEVTFDIDANGILNVSAKDLATGKAQSIRIEASSGLNEQEIQKMVKDGESHQAEDKRRRDEAEVRNKADQLVYETEKNLKEMGDKVPAEDKAKLEAAIGRLKEALKGTDLGEVRSATEALVALWSGVAKTLYERASAGAAGGGAAGGEPGGAAAGSGARGQGRPKQEGSGGDRDGAVDADYEVVE
jgi:molecular chaperone DnaK